MTSHIQIFVYGTLTFISLLGIIFFMLVAQNKRRYRHTNEIKEREYQYRNELLNTKIELQEHLLNEVSREIHDNVGQLLSLVKMNLFTVSNQIADSKVVNLVRKSSEFLDKAIDDLRNISHSNNADLLRRIGLKEALRKEVEYTDNLKRLQCDFNIAGEQYTMPPEDELMIYRIAQEAMHNSLKHSKATYVNVSLDYGPRFLTLIISDNGIGFNISNISVTSGIGITHMKHRAKVLKAQLDITTAPSQGTSVTLKILRPNA